MRNAAKNRWWRAAQTGAGAIVVTVAIVAAPRWLPGVLQANPATTGDARTARIVPPGTPIAGSPGVRGDTFYWLESQSARLTARFADTSVGAERGAAGEIHATVRDRDGNETGRLNVTSARVQYVPAAAQPVTALNDSGERPTLYWAIRQAYILAKDASAGPLEWREGLLRPKGAPPRDVDRALVALTTEWSDGLTATATRGTTVNHTFVDTGTKRERVVSGETLTAKLTKDGAPEGFVAWFAADKVLLWQLPSLPLEGYLAPEHLAQFGGWPFAPDAEWLNLQTIAFYHFKTVIDEKGFVAANDRRCGPGPGRPSLAARIADFFEPALHANETGCDGLHWLDGTVLRFCCDMHDSCYSSFGCSSTSWWTWWSNWTCTYCNMFVIQCFASGGCGCRLGAVENAPADHRRIGTRT